MIGLAVLLIVGSAAIAGLLALRLDSRVAVLVAARPISVGQQVTKDDLAVQRIAGDGLNVLPADRANTIVGSYAAQDVPQGRLIDTDMLTSQGFLKEGTVAVGVLVGAGRMPASGLRPGDRVQVVLVQDNVGTVIVQNAVVSSAPVAQSSGGGGSILGGGGGSSDTSGGGVATLIVDPASAPKVAAASAANRLALVLISRGAGLGG